MEWSGRVTDAEGDLFTAILTPADHEGADVLAGFSMSKLGIEAAPGDLIRVTPESVRKVEPRAWAQREIDEIMARARERSRLLHPGRVVAASPDHLGLRDG